MTIVLDASAMVAALLDTGPEGTWALSLLAAEPLAAPDLMPAETANILRRSAHARLISDDAASLAHADLLDLPIEYFQYGPFAERVWELRDNLTVYDAWYVALAESLDARLATLDRKLARAAGLCCAIITP